MSRALPSVPLCVCWLQAPGHLQRCCLDFTRWDAARQGVPAPGRVRQPSRQPTFLSQGGCGLSQPWRTSTDTRTHEPPVHAHAAHTTVHGCPRSHTLTHTHTCSHTQAPPHACTCTHTHTPRQTHGFTYRLVHTQAHTDQGTLHVSTHTDPLTYTHTHTHTCSHIGSHMLAHTCSRTALRTGSPPPRGAPPAAHAPASPTAPSGSSGLSPVPLLREIL